MKQIKFGMLASPFGYTGTVGKALILYGRVILIKAAFVVCFTSILVIIKDCVAPVAFSCQWTNRKVG